MMAMLLSVAAALLTLVPSSLALKVHVDEWNSTNGTPGAHFHSVAGESFDLNQPGQYVLLRSPRSPSKPAQLRLDGYFLAFDYAPCVMYLEKVAIHGEWLGNKKVIVGMVNDTLSVKVSSTSPRIAGPWRSVKSFKKAEEHGLGAFPGDFEVAASPFRFRVGPKGAKSHAVIRVAQGLREGLDLSLSNLHALDAASMGGLLGTEAHEKSIENRSATCEAHVQRMSKHPRASHVATSWATQPTHLRNLANEAFFLNKPGDFELLRTPKPKEEPALVRAWGTFLAAEADNASCVVYLRSMTLSGEWLGGKVVHVSSVNGSFSIKVSSTEPPSAGTWVRIEALANATTSGLEALPTTVKVTSTARIPSFQFHLGPKEMSSRPSIRVAQALHGGLDVSLLNMKNTGTKEIAGLLGTDKHDAGLSVRTADCEARLRRFHELPGGSSLAASLSAKKRHRRAASAPQQGLSAP